jgi:hypothetical protein
VTALSYQEQQDAIAAVEDVLIQSLPHKMPMMERIALVNDVRKALARVLGRTKEAA